MCYNARRKTMTAEGHPLKNRIAGIINCLNNGMHEREETIAVSLLAALAGQNAFLLGPPGTAKSLIARRIACAFAEKQFFAYLMQRFSTPEEVFGPVSIAELKNDKYVRKPEGFLPRADFAFLDEIWKASPAILNTLLTIINEGLFRNGATEDRVSLKALIAASNETPPDGQGLEALYDRFIVRLHVPPMRDPDNFVKLLAYSQVEVRGVGDLAISTKEWDKWRKGIQKVKLSPETTNVVMLVKNELDKKNKLAKKADKKSGVYVSDRRWQKAMLIVKAAAFFCDRHQTNLADALLLRHCLWTTDKNRDAVIKIVEKAVKDSGFSTGRDFGKLIEQKEQLHANMKKALLHDENVYKTEMLGGTECYKAVVWHGSYSTDRQQDIYMSVSAVNASATDKKWYSPWSENGEVNKNLAFQAAGAASVRIQSKGNYDYRYISLSQGNDRNNQITCRLKVLFHKGAIREFDSPGTRQRLTASFREDVAKLVGQFREVKSAVENQRETFRKELDSPFVPEEKSKIALEGVDNQLSEIDAALQDCEHMHELAKD